jgi:glycosyltransferase involved in cell wall biosynthesis
MKIVIIYHYIAHYRLPVFKELKNSKKLDIDIVAGTKTDTNIKVVTPDKLDFKLLNNRWLLNKKLLWQSSVLSLLFNPYKHYIFLGNPYFISTWISLIICKIIGKKASIWTHGVTFDLSVMKRFFFKILWGLSAKIFVYGHYAKNKMIEYGVDAQKIIVIYNSLDYSRQVTLRNNFIKSNVFSDHFENNNPTLIFTGRLTIIKKLNQILEAMKILKDDGINCNLIFVGNGAERDSLKNLTSKLSLKENVWFYGACYDEELLGNFFMNSKVCIAPGNVGLTAMHSLVFGTPVITHSNFEAQMPEFEAVEDGVTGSFFEKDNIHDLTKKIKFWLTMKDEIFLEKRKMCTKIIDEKYNPKVQREIFEETLL